jgi:hypothetical protein
MIKRIIVFCVLNVVVLNIFAQSTNTDAEVLKSKKNLFKVNTNYKKPSRDYVMIQAGYHTWLKNDTVKINTRNRGHEIAAYLCYDFPLQNASFSFAAGVGVTSCNIYLDSMTMPLNRKGDFYNTVKFEYDTFGYKRYKISNNYIEAPFEIRYFANKLNRNRGFKASVGAKVGTLVNSHTKGVYTNNYKEKEANRRYNDTWRITPTVRLGWGNFSIYGSYQISEVFKAGNIQGIRPATVGICISGM